MATLTVNVTVTEHDHPHALMGGTGGDIAVLKLDGPFPNARYARTSTVFFGDYANALRYLRELVGTTQELIAELERRAES